MTCLKGNMKRSKSWTASATLIECLSALNISMAKLKRIRCQALPTELKKLNAKQKAELSKKVEYEIKASLQRRKQGTA